MANDITQLDDYTKLKKLASALWQQNNSYHGAAIMIGAGLVEALRQQEIVIKSFRFGLIFLNY